MSFPIKNGGSFHSYVSLPEGIGWSSTGMKVAGPTDGKLFEAFTSAAWQRQNLELRYAAMEIMAKCQGLTSTPISTSEAWATSFATWNGQLKIKPWLFEIVSHQKNSATIPSGEQPQFAIENGPVEIVVIFPARKWWIFP